MISPDDLERVASAMEAAGCRDVEIDDEQRVRLTFTAGPDVRVRALYAALTESLAGYDVTSIARKADGSSWLAVLSERAEDRD